MPRQNKPAAVAADPSIEPSDQLAARLVRDTFPEFAARYKTHEQARKAFCWRVYEHLQLWLQYGIASPSPVDEIARYSFVGQSPRLVGEVYERLLNPPAVEDSSPSQRRKEQGAFFTPAPIVEYIVAETLGPVMDRWWERYESSLSKSFQSKPNAQHRETVEDAFLGLSVCDPAAGAGFFLLAATDFIADWIGLHCSRMHPDFLALLPQLVAENSLLGLDLDGEAIFWAERSLSLRCKVVGNLMLRRGNALIGDDLDRLAGGKFTAIVGNPPYLGHRADVEAGPLRERYRTCQKQPNLAAAFLERSLEALQPGGRCGLILPKALQYVTAWSEARRMLSGEYRLEKLIDCREAFDDVLLEQTIVIVERDKPRKNYVGGAWPVEKSKKTPRIDLSLASELDCLPAAVDPRSLALWQRLRERGPRLGEISRTAQALGYQAKLGQNVTGEMLPIHRGRQVQPLIIEPATDAIDRAFLIGRDDKWTTKVAAMLEPKVLSQNIVAHVTRPRPRLWIISAPDDVGRLCLNTISATWIQDERFTRAYVSAILNSSLASWFFSELVFCRAVRTMHLDDAYVGKLPIAELSRAEQRPFASLAKKAAKGAIVGKKLQGEIDRLVFAAYKLKDAEQTFVHEYCYGVVPQASRMR